MRRIASVFVCIVAFAWAGCSSAPAPRTNAGAGGDDTTSGPASGAGVGPASGAGGGSTGSGTGTPCKGSDGCAGALVCDHALESCVECRASSDCMAGSACVNHACAAATPCQSDLQCSSVGHVCDAADGRCVDCNTADDCAAKPGANGNQACLGHSCIDAVPCTSSVTCASMNMVCATALPPEWPSSFAGMGCAECGSDVDCPAGEGCQDNLCTKVCFQAGAKCGKVAGVACGTCPNGGTCSSTKATCIVPLSDTPVGEGLVVTADAVFTASRDDVSYVYRIDRKTAVTTTAATVNDLLNSLVENSTDLFWGAGASIYRMAKTGGAPKPVHTFGAADDCYSVAADDAHAYCNISQSMGNWFGIYQVPIAGGAPIALTNPNLLIDVGSMISRGGKLFWSDIDPPGVIAYTPIGGGAQKVLANVQVMNGFQVDDAFVYWTKDSAVMKAPVDGSGGATTLAMLGAGSFSPLAIVAGSLYVAQFGGGLQRIDVATGAATVLLGPTDASVQMVASDGTSVFCGSTGGIFQIQSL